MQKFLSVFVVVLLVALVASVSYTQTTGKVLFGTFYEVGPSVVPATGTDLFTADIWLESMSLTNYTASAVTCTVSDKQSTPLHFLYLADISPYSTWVIDAKDRKFPSGLTWSCGTADSVVGYMRAKR